MNILKHLRKDTFRYLLPKIFSTNFSSREHIFSRYISVGLESWPKDEMHSASARAAFGSARYAICDISIPNISHKATPPRTVILNIIYVPSHTKQERDGGRPVDSLESEFRVCVCVYACIKNARSKCVSARDAQSDASTIAKAPNRKTISIHCSDRPINIINIGRLNYRPDLARWNIVRVDSRGRIRPFFCATHTWACTTRVRGIGFAPRWPFVDMNKEVRVLYRTIP